jgi:multisubunit Na+/H+ antiporter MnhB subunit
MTGPFTLEIGVAALLVAAAIWIVAARHIFTAVLVFVIYGLLLAIVWVQLSAVDVALTEVAIGSGLSGAMLIGAAARLRTAKVTATEGSSGRLRFGAALLSVTVAAALAAAVLALPNPAPTLAPAAAANAVATGLGNPVTNVLIAFRAIDTMLEKVVVLLAFVGVWSLAPERLWREHQVSNTPADPGGVLVFAARLLAPVGVIVGLYILTVGANNPGGAFQAGAILAAMWLLVLMARLSQVPSMRSGRLRLILIAGPLVFLLVGLGGLWFGAAFLAYPVAFAKPLIVTIECAMTLTVAATLALLAGTPEWSAK